MMRRLSGSNVKTAAQYVRPHGRTHARTQAFAGDTQPTSGQTCLSPSPHEPHQGSGPTTPRCSSCRTHSHRRACGPSRSPSPPWLPRTGTHTPHSAPAVTQCTMPPAPPMHNANNNRARPQLTPSQGGCASSALGLFKMHTCAKTSYLHHQMQRCRGCRSPSCLLCLALVLALQHVQKIHRTGRW